MIQGAPNGEVLSVSLCFMLGFMRKEPRHVNWDDHGQFPGNKYFAAGGDSASANMWNNGDNCGKWFKIQCVGNGCIGSGEITIKIVDQCPNGCSGGRTFDLSSEAFAAITDPDVGVITITYWPA